MPGFVAPALAETVIYPVPDGTLQNNVGVYNNVVAPSGSASGKSNSISGNTVIVNGGTAVNAVGAVNTLDSAAVTGNQVIVNGGTMNEISGGLATGVSGSATANSNSVTINNGTMFGAGGGDAFVNGGSGSAMANNNTVTFNNGWGSVIFGGYAQVIIGSGSAMANNNTVTINGGMVDIGVFGGDAGSDFASAMANNNTVTINNGTVNTISGGVASTGSGSAMANNNTVTINGGTVSDTISGGSALVANSSPSASFIATGNRVNISGGVINSAIISGGSAIILNLPLTGNAVATHNTVTISGSPVFGAGSALYGGMVVDDQFSLISGDAFTGNRLNVWDYHGSAIKSAQNFQFYNFILPAEFQAGDTALTVTDRVNFQDGNNPTNFSSIEAVNFMGGGRVQQAGEIFNLIYAGGGFDSTNIANDGQTLTGKKGVSLLYDGIRVERDDLNNIVTATILGGPRVNPQTQALSEGWLSGLALVTQGADLIAGRGIAEAVNAARVARESVSTGLAAFGTLSGGWSRYNTGSHVEMSSLSVLAGLSYGADLAPGHLTLGGFFEYGNGSYDTYNSFSNAAAVHGNGDLYHAGGGVLGHFDFADTGLYAEASFRAGGVHNEYSSGDLRDALGRSAGYNSSSAYYGLHLGAGYVLPITQKASLDFSGKYFWTRQSGDSVTLTTGDPIKFDAADSHRLRLGGRFAYAVNKYVAPYVGGAWEHEFDGQVKAATNGFAIDAPSLRGDTGIGELGLTLTPRGRKSALSVDFGVQGYVGKREGVTGSLQLKLEF